MISSKEFQQKLQTGQIHEALALLVRDATELDVTTRMTEDSRASDHPSGEYLHTKINLLTGDIQHEVSKNLVLNSSNYIQLQQLHIDKIVDSNQIIQDYLDRIKSILTVLVPSESPSQADNDRSDSIDRLKSDSLLARLNQFVSISRDDYDKLDDITDSTSLDQPSTNLAANSNLLNQQQSLESTDIDVEIVAINDKSRATIGVIAIDDDIDLSIDKDDDVWEEWVEEKDVITDSAISPPPLVLPVLTMPDWEENWVRRQLNPIEVKPIIPRATSQSVESSARWDKFEPEYMGVRTNIQPRLGNNGNSDQTDLDI
jgi:hypothetical protein